MENANLRGICQNILVKNVFPTLLILRNVFVFYFLEVWGPRLFPLGFHFYDGKFIQVGLEIHTN